MGRTTVLFVALVSVCIGAQLPASAQPGAPFGLMCELLTAPESALITDPRPEFSWIVNDPRRGAMQSAYELQVSSRALVSRLVKPDVWDSGKVRSDRSVAVEFAGPALQANRSYWWRVRTWDVSGRVSPYSEVQRFRCGDFEAARKWPGESRWVRVGEPAGEEWLVENRHPVALQRIRPVTVLRKGEGSYFVDFGRAAYGTLALTLETDNDNQAVEIHLGEKRTGPDTIDRNPGGTIRYRKLDLPLRKGRHEYLIELPRQSYGIRMPQHLPEVLPFRYCEINRSPSPLDSTTVVQLAAFYRFQDDNSDFSSSSQVLNRVWDLCKYSIKATTALGIYIDGDRERLPYEADAYINQLGHYAVDREYALGRYSHEYLLFHPTWPTEWTLHSVLMAWADYLYTGDAESITRYYEDLRAKTLIDLAGDDGLIVSSRITPKTLDAIHLGAGFKVGPRGFRDIVDWPPGETDGYEFKEVNTVVNAFHYQSLTLMQKIAAALKKDHDSRLFADRANRVRSAINEKLTDPKTGVYVDGEGSAHSSLHANMFPLALGLVPAERKAAVAQFVKSKGMACSVYGSQWLLEALYEAGEDEQGLRLMTDTATDRSWPHMIDPVGTTITLEAWDIKYKPNLDWNHAWGAAPANIIPRKLMGIEPLEPGFRRVRIRPQPGSLETASVRFPTVRGEVRVDYKGTPGRKRTLNVTLPANCSGEVQLPTGRTVEIRSGTTELAY